MAAAPDVLKEALEEADLLSHTEAPMEQGRVPTFALNVEGHTPRGVAEHLSERDIAVWDGNYYAVEVMERLGLGAEGAVRIGLMHYNTTDEVDRFVGALNELRDA